MNLVARVKNILVTPNTEWPVIAVEPTDVQSLYIGYIAPLAAIPAVCGFIGNSLIFARYGFGFGGGLVGAVVQYLVSLGLVYLMGFIIAKLAPRFGGQDNMIAGLKVAAYSYTASWVAGVLLIIPSLGLIAGLAGLYSLYLLYLGLPVVMGTPTSNSVAYTVTIIVVAVVLTIVIGLIISPFMIASTLM